MNYARTALLLFLISACATSFIDKDINQQKSEDLAKTFEIQDNEFKKFTIEEVSPKETSKTEQTETIVAVPELKATPGPQIPVKKRKKSVITATPSSGLPKNDLTDYPQNYLKLDERSKKLWESFKPASLPGENQVIKITFLGLHVGNLVLTNMPINKMGTTPVYHYKARFVTEKFYETFYKIDDVLESFVSVDGNVPMRYSLIQRESGQEVDDLQFFDFEKMKTFHWFRRLKEGKEKKNEVQAYIPNYIQDSFSVIYFVRGLPLNVGDQYDIPVFNKAELWHSKVTVLEDTDMEWNNEKMKVIRLRAENTLSTNSEKKNSVEFWYSNDQHRRLLKFAAKVKIGSVEGSLLLFEPGGKKENSRVPSSVDKQSHPVSKK